MFIEGFRHRKVLIDIISHDLFSIPVVEWVVTAAAPILQMQRLSLREVRAPKITDSEYGVLTSCVPFSCNCHIHWPHSLCTQLFGRLPGPSFNLSDLFIKDEAFGVPALCSGVPFPASCGAWAKVLLLVLMCALMLNSHTPLTRLLSPSLAAITSSQCFQLSSSWQFSFFPANLVLHLKGCYTLTRVCL